MAHLSRFRAVIVAASFACALLGSAVTSADRVALPMPRTAGVETAQQREGFRASLAGGLASSGHDVVAPAVLNQLVASVPALRDCDTDTCMAKIGELTSAGAVLRSAIEIVGSSNYHFHLDLYDARAHRVASSVDDTCTICTTREANEALSRTAAALGRLIPSLPVPRSAVAPTAAPPAPRHATVSTPRSRLFLGLGVGALVIGLGAVGGGAALVAIDGRTRDGFDAMGQPTRSTLSTIIPGAVLLSAGGLLLAGTGVLLWRSHATRAARPSSH